MATIDYNQYHNSTVLSQLQPGDRIQFPRQYYSHWGIYLGNEEVAHIAGDGNDGLNGAVAAGSMFSCSGVRTKKAKISIDNFWDIVGKSRAKKNNGRDEKQRPLPVWKIISRAKQRLEEEGYNIFKWNCEHFVNWCRYDDSSSDQADFAKSALIGGGLLVGAAAIYYMFKDNEKEKKQKTSNS